MLALTLQLAIALLNCYSLRLLADQAAAGNDVESASSEVSAPSVPVHVAQVERDIEGNSSVVSTSEETTSVSIATRRSNSARLSDSAMVDCEPVPRVDQHQEQRCVAASA